MSSILRMKLIRFINNFTRKSRMLDKAMKARVIRKHWNQDLSSSLRKGCLYVVGHSFTIGK